MYVRRRRKKMVRRSKTSVSVGRYATLFLDMRKKGGIKLFNAFAELCEFAELTHKVHTSFSC